jgi:uncharacterized protein with GYD domain
MNPTMIGPDNIRQALTAGAHDVHGIATALHVPDDSNTLRSTITLMAANGQVRRVGDRIDLTDV